MEGRAIARPGLRETAVSKEAAGSSRREGGLRTDVGARSRKEVVMQVVLAWDPRYKPGAPKDRTGCLGGNRRYPRPRPAGGKSG